MNVMATKTCRILVFICVIYSVLPNPALGQTDIPKTTERTLTDPSQANKDEDTDSSIPSPILGSLSRQTSVIPHSQHSSVIPTKESKITIRTSRETKPISTSRYTERLTTDGKVGTSTSTPKKINSETSVSSKGLPYSEPATIDTMQMVSEKHLELSTGVKTTLVQTRPIITTPKMATTISGKHSSSPGAKQGNTTQAMSSIVIQTSSENQTTLNTIQPTGASLTNTSGITTNSSATASNESTKVIPTTPEPARTQKQIGSWTTHSTVVDETNSTHSSVNTSVDTDRLDITLTDEFDSGDRLWPVAMALIIGLPTIIVLAVAITVLYRRRLSKPRSMLAMYGENYSQM